MGGFHESLEEIGATVVVVVAGAVVVVVGADHDLLADAGAAEPTTEIAGMKAATAKLSRFK